MIDDFGYLNARIRVRLGQLLPEGFFSMALKLGFSELVKVLGETIYGQDLTGDELPDVDRAVIVHLHRTVGDLPGLVVGKAREAVILMLMRADLANVKTILRGKQAGWTREEILEHLGAGTIPRGLYGLLVEAADAAALAQLLWLPEHPLASALHEAVSTARDPLDLEITLDRKFYTAALRRAQELEQSYLINFMRFEIDALNLATGFKLATLGITGKPQRFFLPGGKYVGLPLFELLAAGELEVLEQLGNTVFGRVSEVKDLSTLERGLHCILLAKAREGSIDVLGAGLANYYILQKDWEAGRIRLLARRSFFGLPSAVVEPEITCQ